MGYLSNADLDVFIAGAGPTGLAMAAEAARFGLRYRIVDKAAHGALHSQALVVQARTLEQFERYELAQPAIASGRRLRRIRIYSDGARILEASFDEIRGSYPFVLFLPQTETERLLTGHVEAQGGKIEREVALESFEERADAIACTLRHADGSQETLTAAYLIGADGAHSTVRRLLNFSFEGDAEPYTFFLGDLRVDGEVPGDELTVHLHSGNVVFLGRMDDTHCRVIIVGNESAAQRDPVAEDFQRAIDDAGIQNLRVSEPRWTAAFRVSERRTPAYSRGRVFLAGDATNIHSPVGGQGMNTGIQDAANLIWKIALVQTRRARPLLLDSYDRERKPVGDALVFETAGALRAATASNWLLERVRDGLLSRIGSLESVKQRLRDTISETGLNYSRSPIVCECGDSGGLCAGDRAPDCEVRDETGAALRIFSLFKEPLHTALMIAPPPDADLSRFAQVFSSYRDVMHGMVLVDGDEDFYAHYAPPGGSLYVIRPDGYVGFHGQPSDLEALEAWCSGLFLKTEER
jgi:2-polyprenyl-6-methoxyphenol hydroxylase-like FAD-dependent oxidoreductase